MSNCIKCGKLLNDEINKYCVTCGAINPNHQDNKKSVEYSQENGEFNSNANDANTTNNAPNNNIYVETIIDAKPERSSRYISNIAFIIVNILILAIIALYTFFELEEGIIAFIGLSILFFYIFCFELLLKKDDLPWWGIFIPIYNVYLLNKLAFNSGFMFFFPIVIYGGMIAGAVYQLYSTLIILAFIDKIFGIIYPIAFLFCLGRKFGRSGIITVLFGFIVIPTIALSNKY